jgi:hypothetical protein
MKVASADDVRAAIAAHLGHGGDWPATFGDVTLHPHQRDALARITRMLDEYRGALLADDVGLGKTFVALAVAREARSPVVVAPAAIRDQWLDAARRAAVAVRFESVERLSRGPAPSGEADLVILDEAHHLRSSTTKRFRAAAALCGDARVLLLSATPVQNRLADLRTILSLFLGTRAHAMTPEQLARYIVRRVALDVAHSSAAALPAVAPARWLPLVADVDCLDRLFALPRAVPPADGDDAGVLLTYTLVRQWSSSRAALAAALRRRLARGLAMQDALRAGRLPSRGELAAWCFADGAQQLAFPELATSDTSSASEPLLREVEQHCDGVRELLAWLGTTPDPDTARSSALRDVLRMHRGERVVAFSEYADTVRSLYRALAGNTRVAMLTHTGGRVAGGPLTRREVLARFAPGAASRTPESDRVDILLTTDVLSEGVNLQDASVIVHLDLSWNPARLEQRVGRLRRLGAARDAIAVYMFAPPAPAERLLRLEERLRLKLGAAARTVGLAGAILPGLVAPTAVESAAPREERIATALRAWGRLGHRRAERVAGAARSSMQGALACVRTAGSVSIVAVVGSRVTASRVAVEQLLSDANGATLVVEEPTVRGVENLVLRWLRGRELSNVVDLPALRVAQTRRVLLHRVACIARRIGRHVQPRLAPLMRAARTAATATLSAGAERVLDELARSPMTDEAWLHALGEFAALHSRDGGNAAPEILALLLLRPA